MAYVLFFRISATAGATNVMLVTLLIPVTATGLGAAFLGEELTVHQIMGALIIGSGLLIIDGRLLRFARGAFAPARRLGQAERRPNAVMHSDLCWVIAGARPNLRATGYPANSRQASIRPPKTRFPG